MYDTERTYTRVNLYVGSYSVTDKWGPSDYLSIKGYKDYDSLLYVIDFVSE